jgi:quercetin 2,3-dioxygenase
MDPARLDTASSVSHHGEVQSASNESRRMEWTMIVIRPAADRGHFDHGWLDTHHTFSFADYYDPEHVGFSVLRVINEDRVAPGEGFPSHPHRDMEILTYVLEGALQHRDSMGNGSVIRVGDVQRMSAGTGVVHSEYNASDEEPVHFLQIWIVPSERGIAPGYEQKPVPPADPRATLRLVASPDGRDGSVRIHQNAFLYVAGLGAGDKAGIDLAAERRAWVQVARGEVELNGKHLQAGDGARVEGERALQLRSTPGGEVLVFDLP